MGGALAIALSRAGFEVESLVYRTAQPEQKIVAAIEPPPEIIQFEQINSLSSEIILLTTDDTELPGIADQIAPKIKSGSVLLHASGALSSDVLRSAASGGIATGSIHPLVSVSDPVVGADNFSGAYFCLEGDESATAAARNITAALGGNAFFIDKAFKPLYHASAVLASGHLVALVSTAVKTLTACGIAPFEARNILLPLIKSSVANLAEQLIPAALTGPFARSDVDAVTRHLDAFDKVGLEAEKDIYIELGLEALRVAEAGGGNPQNIEMIRKIMMFARNGHK